MYFCTLLYTAKDIIINKDILPKYIKEIVAKFLSSANGAPTLPGILMFCEDTTRSTEGLLHSILAAVPKTNYSAGQHFDTLERQLN